MQNYIDVSKIKEKEIYSLGKNFSEKVLRER